MEQKEKIQKPKWVEVLEKDYRPIVHQMVGNLCTNMIQVCLNLYGMNAELYFACIDEVNGIIEKEVKADADSLAAELVDDALKRD